MHHAPLPRLSALALAFACGAAASAAAYDPTGQAGRYETVKSATLVRGTGGTYKSVRVWAPWLLDESNAFQNSAAVTLDEATGLPVAAVTTFTGARPEKHAVRVIAALGTSNANSPAHAANNIFVSEGDSSRSDTLGALLADGTLVWRANYSSGTQNNIEFQLLPTRPTLAPESRGVASVFAPAPGIDDASTGAIFLGVPGAERLGAVLYTGVTLFDGGSGACPVGTSVYIDAGNRPTAPYATWLQVECPLLRGASAADTRQTQPVLKRVISTCNPGGEIYACFGVGYAPSPGSTSPYSGGSARPQYLVVDRADPGAFANGYATIDAGGPAFRFVASQATGSGAAAATGGMFDINARAQVVAIREDRSHTPAAFDVLLFNPIRDANCRITGYESPVVIATAGRNGIEANVSTTWWNASTNSPTSHTLVPFSGVSIDDEGNIAFTAITEQFGEMRDVSLPSDGILDGPVIIATTTTLFFWREANDALYAVLKGGQGGDVLTGDNAVDLRVGAFPVDTASDAFTRAGLSDHGRALALCFRSQTADGVFAIEGGALTPGAETETPVRGVVVLSMGPFTPNCPGDTNADSRIDFTDLQRVLNEFGETAGGLAGDVNDDGAVDLRDLNLVLSSYGKPC